MKEYLHLLIECLDCYAHGFKAKTGAEPYALKRAAKWNAQQQKEKM